MDILKRPTLVLNRSWVPIDTKSVQDALTMLFGEWKDEKGKFIPKARVLDTETWQPLTWAVWSQLEPKEGEPVVRGGCGQRIRVPEIIITTNYHKIPKNQLNFNKRNMFRRDDGCCQYCGKRCSLAEISNDHVIPKSKGGKTNWTNCVVACFSCNQKKRDRTPSEAGMTLLREPHKPGLEILGHSSVRMKSWEMFFGRKAEDISYNADQ